MNSRIVPLPLGEAAAKAAGEGCKSVQILRPSPCPLPEGEGGSSSISTHSHLYRPRLQWLLLILVLWSPCSFAQGNSPVDLTGTWRWVNQEDSTNRLSGVDPGGRYEGLPLNDAARMRADTYSEEWLSTSPLLQCRPR